MTKLKPYKILVYHDEPQLFLAKDRVGTSYLCMAVESESERAEYFSIPISIEKLKGLIEGIIDLRYAFQNSEMSIWYKVEINDNEEFIATPFNYDLIDEKYLPSEGFYFPSLDIDSKG